NEIALYIRESSAQEWTELRTVIVNDLNPGVPGWQNVVISLADYADKTIEVRIQPTVKVYTYVLIDCVNIDSHELVDLEARSISAPAFVPAGDKFEVTVNIANNGLAAVDDFTVELNADGVTIDTLKGESLPSGGTKTLTFNCTMGVLAVDPIGYAAVVKADTDGIDTNNSTETFYVEPKLSRLPAVDDLKAEAGSDGVSLTWSEPDLTLAPAEKTEVDFEDGDSFAMEYDGWTFVDIDKSPIGGFGEIDLPGITPGETTAAFFVFDNSGDEFGVGFDTHSGNMCLAAMFRYDDEQVDDWAISPELSGGPQTISFYARGYSGTFSETMEFYYSTGSTDPADFIKIGDAIEGLPRTWELYEFDVPAGAKHFAIRSCATAGFMLMLDDFSFEKAGSQPMDLSIIGYDVYRNGVKLTAEPTAECEYLDATAVEDTDYSYVVVTLYEEGISGASTVASIAENSV
ncbi:MAG: choice-of-anchor J domain-containing protein, partial [Muribaculaceae bacterium]|nr:choice-of-anchor J domain-containing protein [Muribaculaceae bacterium]